MSASEVKEISARDAWKILEDRAEAVVVDVRTVPEWQYVGVPDLSALRRKLLKIWWQSWPTMSINAVFLDELRREVGPEHHLLFLCRSGARSLAAAKLAAANGFKHCYNVSTGFEGQKSGAGQRVGPTGWKHEGLPWIQE